MDNEQKIEENAKADKFMNDIEPIMDAFVKDEGIVMMIVVAPDGFAIRSNLNRDGQAQLLIDTLKAVVEGEGDAQAT